jgi:hypothetical protein
VHLLEVVIYIKMGLREVGLVEHRLDRFGSVQGQVVGFCEYGHEPSGSIKYRKFIE